VARPRGAWWTPEQAEAAVAARQRAADDADYAQLRARAGLPPIDYLETAGGSPSADWLPLAHEVSFSYIIDLPC
jgi:hypothetical protein